MRGDWSGEIALVRDFVRERYVFPEVASSIAELLSRRVAEGAYRDLDDPAAFAVAVTADLRSVNGDKHLRLRHRPTASDPMDERRYVEEARLHGHGVTAVRRLDGNVGVLDLRLMYLPVVSGAAVVAAMNLLADADALLIDLRRNPGGDPAMVALVCSFLFDEPTHLNDLYSRPADSTTQFWTAPYVPGPRFGATKPVYVLTSAQTFSAAEELANNLRELGRATVVGEVTRGGANPASFHRVTAHLHLTVPDRRAVNPVSGGNWEGVGVQPHVAADDAFEVAYRLALRATLPSMEDNWDEQVTAVRDLVAERYVFPELATSLAELLDRRLAEGAYRGIADEEALAAAVTADLQSLNGDHHLLLKHHTVELSDTAGSFAEEAALAGYGIAEVRRLDGNVGLLDLRELTLAGQGGGALTAAMNLLATADALLIDLRRNGGGEPGAVALLCGHLFDEPTHLGDFHSRVTGATHQSWTPPYVPGPRFGGGKPVWVLTSAETFSGAEELATVLSESGRATLVGRRTAGAANPAEWHRLTAHLQARVPTGRPISVVTGGNWEGAGVQPHVETDDAFDTAYASALRHVLDLGDEDARRTIAEQAARALDQSQSRLRNTR